MSSSISMPAGREGGRGDRGRGSTKGTDAGKGWLSQARIPRAPEPLLPCSRVPPGHKHHCGDKSQALRPEELGVPGSGPA